MCSSMYSLCCFWLLSLKRELLPRYMCHTRKSTGDPATYSGLEKKKETVQKHSQVSDSFFPLFPIFFYSMANLDIKIKLSNTLATLLLIGFQGFSYSKWYIVFIWLCTNRTNWHKILFHAGFSTMKLVSMDVISSSSSLVYFSYYWSVWPFSNGFQVLPKVRFS